LIAALEHLTSPTAPQGELRPLTEKLPASLGFGDIAGSDTEFRAALAIAAKAARARLPVLVEGEPGTGKQMVAEAIHAASSREKRNLVIVHGGAIAPNLLESELFGHEPGAFAGAFTRQAGKLVAADGGTVLIDEVGALPLDAQTRLLHFIETGEARAMGARTARHVDVRIIATSSRPLLAETEAGMMREDLYYRLATVHVTLPPLRARSADISPIVRHLMARVGGQPGMHEIGITEDALALLAAWDWPGNVRQLHSTLFRAAIACDGTALTALDFPQIAAVTNRANRPARANDAGVALFCSDGQMRELAAIEADVIRLAIGHYRGRMTEVARRLGIGRSTLYRKLAELGISDAA
jgi:DNA-binding NtrC family response regulator